MRGTRPPPVLAGRYFVEEEAGAGGMASVWRATDEVLSRPVAVKLLHPHLAEDPSFVERFTREAVAAARLTHPNVVSVFDTGEEGGRPYIVMEFLPGRSLAELLREEAPVDPARAVSVVLSVLTALRFAHERGIVHRDVKPRNVLMDGEGRVKVSDFGIARAAYVGGADLTTTGSVLGSVPYLSPEQVAGKEVDRRSDLYSVGVILYELLTGRRPFEAETDLAQAMMRLTADPMPPRAVVPGIPRQLEAVVVRALARDPGDRFQTAEEMAAALERVRRAEAPTDPTVPRPAAERGESFFRAWMLVPLIVLVAGIVAVVWGLVLGRLEFGGPLGIQPAEDGPATGTAAPPALGGAYQPAAVTDFDPFGTLGESPELVPLAFDGDPATYWQTEGYDLNAPGTTGLTFRGGQKPGTGILVDLGGSVPVTGFALLTPAPGWSFEVRIGDDPVALAEQPGQSFTAGSQMRESLAEPSTGRYVLLWVTSVVRFEGANRATVAELDLFGPDG
ncbi:MAG: protein kinase [Actinobacteria bacterium]|nr:protein kinase [Actinomycetota bacterium]